MTFQSLPMDEMEAFTRARTKRFPRYSNEIVDNTYTIGQWLEVCMRQKWVTATVIDKENNWIVVHFDELDSKFDQTMI